MPARLRTGVLLMFAALASILVLSACGGSSKPKHGSSGGNALIAFSKCMRTHGVTTIPASINEQSPAFLAAAKACKLNG